MSNKNRLMLFFRITRSNQRTLQSAAGVLSTQVMRQWFYLYLIQHLYIYSRKIIEWAVHAEDLSSLRFAGRCRCNGRE